MTTNPKRDSKAHWISVLVLALFVMSIPSENGITLAGFSSLSRLVGLVAFAVGAASLFRNGSIHARRPSLFLLLALLFVLWSLSTLLWSDYPSATLGRAATYAQLFALVWLTWQYCQGAREAAILLQAFVAGSYITITVALIGFFGAESPAFRDVGGLNPNEFSIVTALAIPMAWRLAFYWKEPLLVWLNLLYPLFAVTAVLLAASRGGLLTALVALTVIPLTLHRFSLVRRLLIFGLITATVWTAFVQAPTLFPELQRNIERLSSTSAELSEGDLTGRTAIWAAGMDLFSSSPMVGIGMGSFFFAVEPILGEPKNAHNAFLDVAVGGGLIALLLYLGLVAIAGLSSLFSSRGQRVFLSVLLAALLTGMMPSNSANDKYAWFIFALVSSQNPIVIVSGSSSQPSLLRRGSTPA